jgi:hypothetical protein
MNICFYTQLSSPESDGRGQQGTLQAVLPVALPILILRRLKVYNWSSFLWLHSIY